MNPQHSIEYLTGFMMGALLGFGITAIILVIYNLFCAWRGCVVIGFTWWHAIPLPFLLGVIMANAIANSGLGD
ncbi:MAG: hypothetical protein ACWGOY_15460 [Anaerolineales bacterium]